MSPSLRAGEASKPQNSALLPAAKRILGIMRDERRLALDDDQRIIGEYKKNLSASGQPGLGDAFLVWVLTNWANQDRCDLVVLTEVNGEENRFDQFPDAAGLEPFDPSDRKFVAVANAHAEKPPIVEALDSKWWGWKDALKTAGITVVFLCQDEVEAAYRKKFSSRAAGGRELRERSSRG